MIWRVTTVIRANYYELLWKRRRGATPQIKHVELHPQIMHDLLVNSSMSFFPSSRLAYHCEYKTTGMLCSSDAKDNY